MTHASSPPPSRLIQSLATACREHRLLEKSLLVPSYAIGHQILDALAAAAGGWLNLRLEIPLTLALKTAAPQMAAEGWRLAPDSLLDAILHHLYERLEKRFFPPRATPGILAAVRRTLEELRLAGLGPADLASLQAAEPAKAADLEALLGRYDEALRQEAVLDAAAVFQAARAAGAPREGLLLVPESLRLPPVAVALLNPALGRVLPLAEDPVVGLEPPARRVGSQPGDPSTAASPLSFLFAPQAAPGRPALDIFAAVGERNECREVLRRILARAIPLDQIEILLADYPAYSAILDDLRTELGGLPITFGNGLPPSRSGPTRAVAAFARWIAEGYPEVILRRLLASGDLTAPEEISGRRAARMLRAAKIGMGLDRYARCLDGYCEDLAERIPKAEETAEAERLAARLHDARVARTWILDIVRMAPAANGSASRFLSTAREFLKRHVAIRSPEDAAAFAQLDEALMLGPDRSGADDTRYVTGEIPPAEGAERILAAVEGLAVRAAGPAPGHLHVSGLAVGGYAGRPVAFVLGLDDARCPGTVSQDPILSDSMRERLGAGLDGASGAARARETLYRVGECLARLRGDITLSFAAFDLADGRRRFPSPILLQAHRLRTGDPAVAYEGLLAALGAPIGFVHGLPALDATDWWLRQVHVEGLLRNARASVLCALPDLARGALAETARAGAVATAFDGVLCPDLDRDPRQNRALVLSASRLERYPRCPRQHFLQYVLQVEPPDDLALEPGVWLDALARGTLLHDFYRRFLAALAARGESPDPGRHLAEAERVLGACVQETRQQVPPPSEAIFELEAEALRRSVRIFLEGEASRRPGNRPSHFEVAFGLDEADGIGTKEPIEIALPVGRIGIRGKIDRLDRLPQTHAWEVWDYKTGRVKEFRGPVYTSGGTQLQHALYALAARALLRRTVDPAARIAGSGYLFPTEGGEGEAIRRDPGRTDEALAVVGRILDGIRDGIFLGSGDGCGYCDYAPVCRGSGKARWKHLETKGDPAAARLSEVWNHA